MERAVIIGVGEHSNPLSMIITNSVCLLSSPIAILRFRRAGVGVFLMGAEVGVRIPVALAPLDIFG